MIVSSVSSASFPGKRFFDSIKTVNSNGTPIYSNQHESILITVLIYETFLLPPLREGELSSAFPLLMGSLQRALTDYKACDKILLFQMEMDVQCKLGSGEGRMTMRRSVNRRELKEPVPDGKKDGKYG